MEYELTCCICLELFENPVILPCSHNLCRGCVWSLASCRKYKGKAVSPCGGRFHCPSCRLEVEFHDISALPCNKVLDNIVKLYKCESEQGKRENQEISEQRAQDELSHSLSELSVLQRQLSQSLCQLRTLVAEIEAHGERLKKAAEISTQQLINAVLAKKEDYLRMLEKRLRECSQPVHNRVCRLTQVEGQVSELTADCQQMKVSLRSAVHDQNTRWLTDHVSTFLRRCEESHLTEAVPVTLPDCQLDVSTVLHHIHSIRYQENVTTCTQDDIKVKNHGNETLDVMTHNSQPYVTSVTEKAALPQRHARYSLRSPASPHPRSYPHHAPVSPHTVEDLSDGQSSNRTCTSADEDSVECESRRLRDARKSSHTFCTPSKQKTQTPSTNFGMDLNLKFNFSSPSVPSPCPGSRHRQSPSPAKRHLRPRGGLPPRSLFKTAK